MKKSKIVFSAFFLPFLFLTSCVKKDMIFEFDKSDPYAFDIEVEWAVVTDPYAVCRTDVGYECQITNHFRKGDIRRIIGEKSKKIDERMEVWYCFEEGWIPSTAIKIYSNKLKAIRAVEEMNLK